MNDISKAASAFGRMGGKANIEKNGKEHMRNIARERWRRERENAEIEKEKNGHVDISDSPTE